MEKRTADSRIAGLSYAKFEEEFGFKPKNKIEQNLFALKLRKPSDKLLRAAERLDALIQQGPPEPQPLP